MKIKNLTPTDKFKHSMYGNKTWKITNLRFIHMPESVIATNEKDGKWSVFHRNEDIELISDNAEPKEPVLFTQEEVLTKIDYQLRQALKEDKYDYSKVVEYLNKLAKEFAAPGNTRRV